MQTRELWNRSKWKVVASAAAVTALGVGGMAIAQDDEDTQPPDGIALEDLVSADIFQSPDVVAVDTGGEVSELDSPLDEDPSVVAGAEDSPDDDGAGAPESPDSPDDGVTGAPDDTTTESGDSPVAPDSPDSPDSPDDDDTSS